MYFDSITSKDRNECNKFIEESIKKGALYVITIERDTNKVTLVYPRSDKDETNYRNYNCLQFIVML